MSNSALVQNWRCKERELKPVPPTLVASGPVEENYLTGNRIDLMKFPSPRCHELDGGRYIGTGSAVVTRDPEEGWVNVGTYRVQIQDRSTVTVTIGPGHDGNIIRKKYWDRGLACPVAICCGQAPMVFAAAQFSPPWGLSEYAWAGGWQRKPIEVTRGVTTDLPVPAAAEIVLEGEIVPPGVETRPEGPFGEFPGYYGGGVRQIPVARIKSVLHRNNPIIQGNPPSVFPRVWTLGRHIQISAQLWNELDRQLPGVKGVWMMEEAAMHHIVVISLQQMYGGHAKQAALLAAGSRVTGYCLRFVIVVDEDIDPSNSAEVLWALGTRTEPVEIEAIRGCWGTWANPTLPPEQRLIDDREHSTGIILACKPYRWMKDFPPSIKTSPELARRVRQKWPQLFP